MENVLTLTPGLRLVWVMSTDSNRAVHASPSPVFATTRWTMVLMAGNEHSPQQTDALNQLCNCYWYPVFAYIRSRGYNHHDSQDLTQSFLSSFLQRDYFARADRRRGKFRSYLLGALKFFLANDFDRKRAVKRGGDRPHVPWDELVNEQPNAIELRSNESPDRAFDRHWAVTLLERVRGRLAEDYAQSGNSPRFELLKPFLPGGQSTQSYADVARSLGTSEGAFRVELHRLKKKFSRYVREEIAHTVSTPIEIDEELRYLIETLQ